MVSAATPKEVMRRVSAVQQAVCALLGVEPDLTPETLPLVDSYLRDSVASLPPRERDQQLCAAGVYFGEVVRRKLNARWALITDAPEEWRVELSSCFLHFRPVGMAAEVVFGCETEAYDGSFGTLDELHDELDEMLQNHPPIPEDEYYSLAGRIEILELVADWLVGRRLVDGGPTPPSRYSAEDYRGHLER